MYINRLAVWRLVNASDSDGLALALVALTSFIYTTNRPMGVGPWVDRGTRPPILFEGRFFKHID